MIQWNVTRVLITAHLNLNPLEIRSHSSLFLAQVSQVSVEDERDEAGPMVLNITYLFRVAV